MAGVRQRKRELVDGLIATHKARFAADGLEFILGEGRFVGPGLSKLGWWHCHINRVEPVFASY